MYQTFDLFSVNWVGLIDWYAALALYTLHVNTYYFPQEQLWADSYVTPANTKH